MTIQSTCHPHSQAASSSLLASEGGGVGEADTGGGAEGQTHRHRKGDREGAEAAGRGRAHGGDGAEVAACVWAQLPGATPAPNAGSPAKGTVRPGPGAALGPAPAL